MSSIQACTQPYALVKTSASIPLHFAKDPLPAPSRLCLGKGESKYFRYDFGEEL